MQKKAIVGLSGGVDSAISAYLMLQAGYDVKGVFMHNWHDDENYCSNEDDKNQVYLVAKHLDIPVEIVDFSEEYQQRVFDHMLTSLEQGQTPNPDILCNQEIKFRCMLDYAIAQQADILVTGHYARILENNGIYELAQGVDHNKDQSYFLCRIPKSALAKIHFPLGNYNKQEVRTLADKIALPNAKRKDSTGICFIGKRRFDEFISGYLLNKPGPIQTLDGKTIAQHKGLFYHTIGQRKGLNIGGGFGDNENPWYVVDKIMSTQTLVVAQGKDHPALFKKQLTAKDMHWLSPEKKQSFNASAKIRHRQPDQQCTVNFDSKNNILHIEFAKAQRAITAGQYVVLYQNQVCLGGATIVS